MLAIDIAVLASRDTNILNILRNPMVRSNIAFSENKEIYLMLSALLHWYGNPLQHTRNRN